MPTTLAKQLLRPGEYNPVVCQKVINRIQEILPVLDKVYDLHYKEGGNFEGKFSKYFPRDPYLYQEFKGLAVLLYTACGPLNDLFIDSLKQSLGDFVSLRDMVKKRITIANRLNLI